MDQKIIESEYTSLSGKLDGYLEDLRNVIHNSEQQTVEGNYFYIGHQVVNVSKIGYPKRLNLFYCAKNAQKICEIGFNGGHSSVLMLLDKTSPVTLTLFDIGHHKYTRPCVEHVIKYFTEHNIEYIEGDSTVTMPQWIEKNTQYIGTYDLVHVDGNHDSHHIAHDIKNADRLVKVGGIMVIDDTNIGYIHKKVDDLISTEKYEEITLLPTEKHYSHRAVKKIA